MCAPTTRSLAASTTSFISVRSSRPESVCFSARKSAGRRRRRRSACRASASVHPHGADRRLAEHRRRHVHVVDRRRLAAEERRARGDMPLVDRDRRQVDAVGHVADRVDARHRCARELVDDRPRRSRRARRPPSSRPSSPVCGRRPVAIQHRVEHRRLVPGDAARRQRAVRLTVDPLDVARRAGRCPSSSPRRRGGAARRRRSRAGTAGRGRRRDRGAEAVRMPANSTAM